MGVIFRTSIHGDEKKQRSHHILEAPPNVKSAGLKKGWRDDGDL